MNTECVEILDTTLRDGAQAEGINLSINDKLTIVHRLDDFGIDVIEGGWPGSNPRDEEFFQRVAKLKLKKSVMCAFGSTARFPDKISSDVNLNMLLAAETPVISIFGKTWKFHAEKGLGLSESENETLIFESVRFLKDRGRRVVFDAEHFFDGFKDNREFALRMVKAAAEAGADVIALCDTNGGSLTREIELAVREVVANVPKMIGIHAHNDGDLAVANTLIAVGAGARMVQGTVNGVGERCGNANLMSIIPSLIMKMGLKTKHEIQLEGLTALSNRVNEVMNLAPDTRAPFVGYSAFAHKGGIHVSAVMKDSRMYEHIEPATVGNKQRVLVSDLAGQSNVRYKAREFGVDLSDDNDLSRRVVNRIKAMEYDGYSFDGAEASFELILRTETNEFKPFFNTQEFKIHLGFDSHQNATAEVVLKIEVGGEIEHTAANGNGPVSALDNALRKALLRFYPEIAAIKLLDYKVRVLNEKDGTSARVRVLIESGDGQETWSTVGVSENIIEASWQALTDSINYKLFKMKKANG